jgi:hypothetical protein
MSQSAIIDLYANCIFLPGMLKRNFPDQLLMIICLAFSIAEYFSARKSQKFSLHLYCQFNEKISIIKLKRMKKSFDEKGIKQAWLTEKRLCL